jgi:hypothetical protein
MPPVVLTLLLSAALAAKPAPAPAKAKAKRLPPGGIECTQPESDEKKVYTIPKLKQSLTKVQRDVVKRGIAVLDLSKEVQDRRRRLPLDVKDADWCVVASHLRAFEEMLGGTEVTEPFVTEKFGRVERWVRSGLYDASASAAAEKHIGEAAETISTQKWTDANEKLNRAILALFDLKTVWELPEVSPADTVEQAGGRQPTAIDAADVEKSCPQIAKRGKVEAGELDDVLARVAASMKERRVRPSDLQGGQALLDDLRAYRRLVALWPATRAACALLTRVQGAEVGLGLVMGRFNRVNELKAARGVPRDIEQRFKSLVRAASDALAEQNYKDAHDLLEQTLVLLGEPEDPAFALQGL